VNPSHWTYCEIDATDSDLKQGDILARTDDLVLVLESVHPHFKAEKYLGFLVLTQTCDLVRRPDGCKTNYITLAVIRSLDPVLDELFRGYGASAFPGVYVKEQRESARQLVERITNQNEQSHGLFYLHGDGGAGISEASVALLRVAFTLRVEHYGMLTAARRGRLRPEFANKLGWLIGNLYSRIGTPDWNDSASRSSIRAMHDALLDKDGARGWLPQKTIEHAISQSLHEENLAGQEAIKRIQEIAPKPPKTAALERVQHFAAQFICEAHVELIQKLVKRLESDKEFSRACRKDW
jgi:hypothetical protein